MAKVSSKVDSDSEKDSSNDVQISTPTEVSRKLYFVNEEVEWLLTQYLWTGCTRIVIRDKIMSNATELIRQIIRKQGLHTIYPGQEESAFGDLLQTAWVQIEKTLYKYRARPHCRACFNPDRPSDSLLYEPAPREYGIKTLEEVIKMSRKCPHCAAQLLIIPMVEPFQGLYGGTRTILYRGMSKVFNMWSQVARTVILAYIKKEGRDRKNSHSYVSHLGNKSRPVSDIMIRFLTEARDLCQFNDDHIEIIEALDWLIHHDDRPHDGIIGKLVEKTGLSRSIVTGFVKLMKLRSFEFTDSPLNRGVIEHSKPDRRQSNVDFDEE